MLKDIAAVMLKDITAEMLARRVWPVKAGETVLVHAAIGGVGTLLTRCLCSMGVRVIGTAGLPDKATMA